MKKQAFGMFYVFLLLAAITVGCASPASPPVLAPDTSAATDTQAAPPEQPSSGSLRMGYTTMDLANPYFVAVVAGM